MLPTLGVKLFFQSGKTDYLAIGKWQRPFLYQDIENINDGVRALLTFMKYSMMKEKRTEPNNSFIFKRYGALSNITAGAVYLILKETCMECGIDADLVGTHSFRKTCATVMSDKGASIEDIEKRLGHVKNSGSTRFYVGKSFLKKKKGHSHKELC